MKTRKTYRAQRPVRGGRERLSSSVLRSIDSKVRNEAARYNVRPSFVIATILAKWFNINNQEDYSTD